MFRRMSMRTMNFLAALTLLTVSLVGATGSGYFTGSGSGSGSSNGSCHGNFDEFDNCDYYVEKMNVTCIELENLDGLDCSGCVCAEPTTTVATTEHTTTKSKSTVTATPVSIVPSTTTASKSSVTTAEDKPSTKETNAAQVVDDVQSAIADSTNMLAAMQQQPALAEATGITLLSSTIEVAGTGNSGASGSTEVMDVVQMSCSVAGYTKDSFGPAQQEAFKVLIAEEAGVSETLVKILAVTEYTPQRARRLRAVVVMVHRGLGDGQVQVDFQIRIPPSGEVDDQETPTYTSGLSTAAIVGMIAGVAAVVGMVVGVVAAVYIVPRMRDASRDSSDQTLNADTNTVSYPDNVGSPKGIEMMTTASTSREHQLSPVGPRTRSANMNNDSGKPKESAAVDMIAVAVDEALKSEEETQTGKCRANTDVAAAGAPKAVETSAAVVGMVHDVVDKVLEQQLHAMEEHGSAEVDVETGAVRPVVSKVLDTQVPVLPRSPTTVDASVPRASIHNVNTHSLSSSSIDTQKARVIISDADEEDDSTLAI